MPAEEGGRRGAAFAGMVEFRIRSPNRGLHEAGGARTGEKSSMARASNDKIDLKPGKNAIAGQFALLIAERLLIAFKRAYG